MKKKFFIFWISFFLFGGCNYNHVKESQAPGGRGGSSDSFKMGSLDFATVQMSVIGPRCLGCHSDATGNKGGANLESYQNVRRLVGRVSFRTFEKQDMPPGGPLPPQEAQLLRAWLDMGAPEVSLGEGGPENLDQGPTDWNKISEKVFSVKCLDCHSQPEAQGNLDLSSYEQVKERATAIFDRVIIKQDMPIEPYPALSLQERKVLLNWMNMGMPR